MYISLVYRDKCGLFNWFWLVNSTTNMCVCFIYLFLVFRKAYRNARNAYATLATFYARSVELVLRARFNRNSLCSFPMQILFVRRKIHRRRCVIRQNDHPLPEKVMALPIYICIPSIRNRILKKAQGVFQNALSPNRNTNTPYGNTPNTRRMQRQHPWLFRVGAHQQVLAMWLPHASHLNNKEQLREGTLRGSDHKNSQPRSWLVVIFIFSVCGALTPTAECP